MYFLRKNITHLVSAFALMAPHLVNADEHSAKPASAGHQVETNDNSNSQSIQIDGVKLHKPLPEALTSFGAAVQDDYLYVFSGHSGDAHGFGRDLLVDHFRRIRFDDPDAEWEELAKNPAAQSTALVSDGTYLYRIGGLTFLNHGGDEETNFKSTDHFVRYDPSKNIWTELEPLPEPRSSLDAAVVGRSIFVAGGWNLQGSSSSDSPWHEDILRFDLDHPDSGWQSIQGPGYKSRALSVASHQDKLYVMGGIQERGITRNVSVYDPQSEKWSTGPELRPDSMMAGFATSAFAVGGSLYITGGSGVVYRLSDDGSEWVIADRLLFPRMFLRMLPAGKNRLIALGGTGNLGRLPVVESLRVDPKTVPTPKFIKWSVPFAGHATDGQSLIVRGSKLYVFGGIAQSSPNNPSKKTAVKECFAFDLIKQSAEQLPDMPTATYGSSVVLASQTSEHRKIVVAGGMTLSDSGIATNQQLMEFNPEPQSWSVAEVSMPRPRAMFDAKFHDEAIWMFGGTNDASDLKLDSSVTHWWCDETEIGSLPNVSTPTPRRSFSGGLLGDEYYLIGGVDGENKTVNQVDVFHFMERSWREIPPPKYSRADPSVCVMDEKIYLFGGRRLKNDRWEATASLEVYDKEKNEWSLLGEQLAEVDPAMQMLALGGRFLFVSFNQTQQGSADFILYDPTPTADPGVAASLDFSSSGDTDQSERNAKMLMRKDTDKDGKLSLDELGKRMADFAEDADTNGDGLISFEEAKEAMKSKD